MPKTPTARREPGTRAVVLRLGPQDYAVAVSRDDQDGEPIYEVAHRDIKDAGIAATVARKERKG